MKKIEVKVAIEGKAANLGGLKELEGFFVRMQKSFEDMQKTLKLVLESTQNKVLDVGKISSQVMTGIQEEAKATGNFVTQTIGSIVGVMGRAVNMSSSLIIGAITLTSVSFYSFFVSAKSSVRNFIFLAYNAYNGLIKKSVFFAKVSKSLFSGIYTFVKDKVLVLYNFVISIFTGILGHSIRAVKAFAMASVVSGGVIKHLIIGVAEVFKASFSIFKGGLFLASFSYMTRNAIQFGRRLLGLSTQLTSPIAKIIGLINVLNDSVNTLSDNFGKVLGRFSIMAVSWLLPISKFVLILGSVNILVSNLFDLAKMGYLRAAAAFGSGKAKFILFVVSIKEAVTNVAEFIKRVFDAIVQKTTTFTQRIFGKFAKLFSVGILHGLGGGWLFKSGIDTLATSLVKAKDVVSAMVPVARNLEPIMKLAGNMLQLYAPAIDKINESIGVTNSYVEKLLNTSNMFSGVLQYFTRGLIGNLLSGNVSKAFLNLFTPISLLFSKFRSFIPFGKNKIRSFDQIIKQVIDNIKARVISFVKEVALAFMQTQQKFELLQKQQAQVKKVAPQQKILKLVPPDKTVLDFYKELNKLFDQLRIKGKGQIHLPTFEKKAANLVFDLKKSRKDLKKAIKSLVVGVSVDDFANLGKKIAYQLGDGIKAGSISTKKAIVYLTDQIMDYLPRSPAKLGALKNLALSGSKIPKYISDGMLQGISFVTKAAGRIAMAIARFFPRSPVATGALIMLIPMGLKIPKYLAQGMLSGISFVIKAAHKLAKAVVEEFRKQFGEIKNLFKASFTLGTSFEGASKLSAVLGVTGSSINDVIFIMRKMKSEGKSVRKVLLDTATAIEKTNGNYTEKVKILEKIGIVSTSSLIPALSQGRQYLENIYDTIDKSGLGVSKLAGEYVNARNSYLGYIKALKTSFFGEIYAGLAKYMKEASKSMRITTLQYTRTIRAAGRFVGIFAGKLYSVIVSLAELALKEPVKSLKAIFLVFNKFLSLAKTDFALFLNSGLEKTIKIAYTLAGTLFRVGTTFVSIFVNYFVGAITDNVLKGIKVLKLAIVNLVGVFGVKAKTVLKVLRDIKKVFSDLAGGAKVAAKGVTSFVANFSRGPEAKLVGLSQDQIAILEKELELAQKGEKVKKETKKKDNEGVGVGDAVKALTVDNISKATTEALKAATKSFKEGMGETFKELTVSGPSKDYLDGLQKRATELVQTVQIEVAKVGGEEVTAKVKELVAALNPEGMAEEWRKAKKAIEDTIILSQVADKASEKRGLKKEKEIDLFQKSRSVASDFGNAMADAYELSGKKAKEFFYISKAIATTEAIIKGALAILEALKMGWIGYAMIPFITATTAVQVAKINSASFFSGGRVSGGSREKDSIPAMLAQDEFVISNAATGKYGFSLLDSINNMTFPDPRKQAKASAAKEVMAMGVNSGVAQGGTEITIVNFTDEKLMKNYLASKDAGSVIVNQIGVNKGRVKQVLA